MGRSESRRRSRRTEEIQTGSGERRGSEGRCGDAGELLNHGTEVGGIRSENSGGCTPRSSRPLLRVSNRVAIGGVGVGLIIGA